MRPHPRSCSPSRRSSGCRFVGSLPACRRLPHESVDVRQAVLRLRLRRPMSPAGRARPRPARRTPACGALATGGRSRSPFPRPSTVRRSRSTRTSPRQPPRVVGDLLDSGARSDRRRRGAAAHAGRHRRDQQPPRDERGARRGTRGWAQQIRVDTPERWQGLERPGHDRGPPAVRRHRPVGVRPRDRPALRDGVPPPVGPRSCWPATTSATTLAQLRPERGAGAGATRHRRPGPRRAPAVLGGSSGRRTASVALS